MSDDEGIAPESGTGAVPSAPPAATPGPPEEQTTRRLMYFLLGLLGIAAIALLVLLFSLLRPDNAPPTDAAEGYPIIPVRSLLANGGNLDDLISKPLGVAFDPQGNVWVADTGKGRVIEFSDNGSTIQVVGATDGPGKLASPYGIAFDPTLDRVYVADFATGKIQVYKTDGSYVTTFPNAKQDMKVFGKQGFFPYDVEVINNRVVASNSNGLFIFDTEGNVLGQWGTKETGFGYSQFSYPDAFTVDPALDRIYIADSLSKRVVAVNSDAMVQWTSGSPDQSGKTTGFWQLPRGIVVGPDHNVYVVDTFRTTETGIGDGYIVKLSPDGKLLSAFGRYGDQDDSLSFPEHIDYNGDGLWAIADREHNRVLLYTLAPLPQPDLNNIQKYPLSFFTGPFPKPIGMDLGPIAEPPAPASKGLSALPLLLLILLLLALAYMWWRRRRKLNAPPEGDGGPGTPTGVEAPEGAKDLSAGFDPEPEGAAGGGTPAADEPETGP